MTDEIGAARSDRTPIGVAGADPGARGRGRFTAPPVVSGTRSDYAAAAPVMPTAAGALVISASEPSARTR
jgi:hypothetical protein